MSVKEIKSAVMVHVDSSRPVFMEVNVDSFGEIFAHMNDDEQIEVLRSMVTHMKGWPMQWDHIAIALELDENKDIRDTLRGLVT